jgi:outer membrane lipoprotein-sorting protein
MKVVRLMLLVALATLTSSGCVLMNNRQPLPTPKPLAQRTIDPTLFVAEHNRNAEQIQSLKATPSIGVAGKRLRGHSDAHLAMQRPRDFKLEMQSMKGSLANIGSNDEKFWFWVQNEEDKSIYWCKYSDLASSELPITFQPDWIVEALGLKPITPEEAAEIRVKDGPERGTSTLIFPTVRNKADTYTRVMIVSNDSLRIREYRILAGDHQTVLGQALIKSYREHEIASTDSSPVSRCYLPDQIEFDWKREGLALDVAVRDVEINQLDPARAPRLFAEPRIEGYTRRNLANLKLGQPNGSGTTVRRTLPPPEPRNGVRLGRPASDEDDAKVVPRLNPAVGQTGSPRKPPFEDLVGATVPAGSDPDGVVATSGSRGASLAYGSER